jgi:hypothetical protein
MSSLDCCKSDVSHDQFTMRTLLAPSLILSLNHVRTLTLPPLLFDAAATFPRLGPRRGSDPST